MRILTHYIDKNMVDQSFGVKCVHRISLLLTLVLSFTSDSYDNKDILGLTITYWTLTNYWIAVYFCYITYWTGPKLCGTVLYTLNKSFKYLQNVHEVIIVTIYLLDK